MDKETVNKLADLARIEVVENEKGVLIADLQAILGYVSELSSAPISIGDVDLGDNINIFREDDDVHETGLYTDKILALADREENGYILVKQVIGEK